MIKIMCCAFFLLAVNIAVGDSYRVHDGELIHAHQFGDDWIFKTDKGVIGCTEGKVSILAYYTFSISEPNIKKLQYGIKKKFKGKDISKQLKVFEDYGKQFCGAKLEKIN